MKAETCMYILKDTSSWNLMRRSFGSIKIDLCRANLSGADLSMANLSRADLSRSNLSGANLSWSNLSDADLSGADLSWANLRGANLRGANLRDADLSMADLRVANLPSTDRFLSCPWGICHIRSDYIRIGCEYHSVDEWESFSDDEIMRMDGKKALTWWNSNKKIIILIAKELKGLQNEG